MAVSRVVLQAAAAQLSALKLFADANGLVIAHAGVKVGSFTRDTSLGSGTQAVTGVGFKPSAVIFLAIVNATAQESAGIDDGTTHSCIVDNTTASADTWTYSTSNSILLLQSLTIEYDGYASSFDADGFTISWTKVGAKTGTATIFYLAFR